MKRTTLTAAAFASCLSLPTTALASTMPPGGEMYGFVSHRPLEALDIMIDGNTISWDAGGFKRVSYSSESFLIAIEKAHIPFGILRGENFDDIPGSLSFTLDEETGTFSFTRSSDPPGGAPGNQGTSQTGSTLAGGASPPAPVPVPAAGLLLLTALGGTAAMRRRKKA